MQQKYTISQYSAQISAPNKYLSIFNPPVNAAPLIAPIGRFGGFAFCQRRHRRARWIYLNVQHFKPSFLKNINQLKINQL